MKIKILFCWLLLIFAVSSFAQTMPPTARVENVTDEYFGTKITDPYRWMEDLKSDETQKWMRAQADYARATLEKTPLRAEFYQELEKINNVEVFVRGIEQRGNRYFYYKIAPDEQDRRIYVREGLTGAERLLVNPDTYSKDGKRFSIAWFDPSPDGKLVAVVLAPGGGEFGEMRLFDVTTGKEVGDRLERMRTSFQWLPDGKSFFYVKYQDLPANAPPSEAYQKRRIFRHIVGTNQSTDKAVLGYEINPGVKVEASQSPYLSVFRGSKYAVARINSGVSPNSEFYIAPLAELNQDAASIKWRKITNLEDEVSDIKIHGDNIYLQTFKNTPRYKIVRFNLKNSELSKAEVFFPASEAVVQNFVAAKDALYVQALDGGTHKIYRVDYRTKKSEPINLPYPGSASLSTDPFDLKEGIYFELNSWTKSPAHFIYHPKTKTSTDTNFLPPSPIDMSEFEFVNAKARSHDGVMIPLVIMYKKGLRRDGKNPTIMMGYGAYGVEIISPYIPIFDLPWLRRGGVYVYAGVRGGGEYGEEWHQAGKGATKPNSWKDFIACAEYLIKEQYTAPEHLGIMGASAGGILISNSIAERPDLFGAAVSSVGLNNALLFETTAGGMPNIAELGSYKTAEGFKNLLAMDGYYKIKDGVKYPAVMLTHGINDPRVAPWMSAKFAARLQAATASKKPILLRIDYDAGHGGGISTNQFFEIFADIYAFLFEQLK